METYLSSIQIPYTAVSVENFIQPTTVTLIGRTFVSFRIDVNLTSPAMSSLVVMLSEAVSALLELSMTQGSPASIIPGSLGMRTFTPSGHTHLCSVSVCVSGIACCCPPQILVTVSPVRKNNQCPP